MAGCEKPKCFQKFSPGISKKNQNRPNSTQKTGINTYSTSPKFRIIEQISNKPLKHLSPNYPKHPN
jgi:hypothetical protein